ncbi:MAG: hypothetical protein EHM87_00280 [Burkholderiales bacterium]|nr:MAG: hypothetical protein EHM87_00280 [Burkholderiales bacterium]
MSPFPRFTAASAGGAMLLVLGACGSGLDSGSSSSSSSPSSSSASSASCSQYVDVIPSNVRSASAADAQCSSYVANADSYLSAAKSACAAGNTSGATAYYAQYEKAADYAVSTVKLLCPVSGSGSSSSGPSLNTGLYTLYLCTTGGGTVLASSCSTGTATPSNRVGCNWYNAGSTYTQTSCQAAQSKL